LTNKNIKDEIVNLRLQQPHGTVITREVNLQSVGDSSVTRLKRKHELISRKANVKTAPTLPRIIIDLYFVNYYHLYSQINTRNHPDYVHPNNIINADETIVINEYDPHKVLQIKGEECTIYGSENNNGQRVALLASITAAGNKLDSVAVVSGKTNKSLNKFLTVKANHSIQYILSGNRKPWVNIKHMLAWLQSIILPHTQLYYY
jgi:hypothetical protein